MAKSLIICVLSLVFFFNPLFAQELKQVRDDSIKISSFSYSGQVRENSNLSGKLSGYAGLFTTGSMTGYYGGINYALKGNQSLNFEMSYGSPFNFMFQPSINSNSRLFAPALLYQYTLIGNQGSGINGKRLSTPGFSLYTFTGIAAQFYNLPGNTNIAESPMRLNSLKSYSVEIPLGIGMNYKFDNNMTIGLEIRGNFHVSNGGYPNPYSYGLNSYQNSFGGYPGVMFGQYKNGPGF